MRSQIPLDDDKMLVDTKHPSLSGQFLVLETRGYVVRPFSQHTDGITEMEKALVRCCSGVGRHAFEPHGFTQIVYDHRIIAKNVSFIQPPLPNSQLLFTYKYPLGTRLGVTDTPFAAMVEHFARLFR